MADFIITHRIEAPDLTAALNNLAEALKGRSVPVLATSEATTHCEAVPVQLTETPVPPVEMPKVAPAPAPQQTSAPAAVAAPTPVPVEPPAAAPVKKVYTFEDIIAAGSQLLDMNKMPQLMELLKGYGVQAVTQLKPEQYADVAAGLRGLGANI